MLGDPVFNYHSHVSPLDKGDGESSVAASTNPTGLYKWDFSAKFPFAAKPLHLCYGGPCLISLSGVRKLIS